MWLHARAIKAREASRGITGGSADGGRSGAGMGDVTGALRPHDVYEEQAMFRDMR